MSGTRQAAVIAMVACALVLSIAVPLRTYFAQRAELREETERQQQLRDDVAALEQRKQQLSDPAKAEAEIRDKLHYVRPGETPYVVQFPDQANQNNQQQPASQQPAEEKAWYEQLWASVTGSGQ